MGQSISMGNLLSIDPGSRGCGCALWNRETRRLLAAAYVANIDFEGLAGPLECAMMARQVRLWAPVHVEALAFEWPQIYQPGGDKTKGDPKVLLPLAGVDAAIAALFSEATKVSKVQPHDWKGGVQKPKRVSDPYPIEGKVRSRLTPEELANIQWPRAVKFTWDVSDALGVGLHALGRFEPRRSFPRE